MTPASVKTFGVTLRVGRRMAGAPFGRLDIGSEGITVRSWLPAWIGPRSAPKDSITQVILYGWPALHIKFADERAKLADVAVNPVRFRRVLREFRARGYTVVDLRLFQRGHSRPDEMPPLG